MPHPKDIRTSAERGSIDIKVVARKLAQNVKREKWAEALEMSTYLNLELMKLVNERYS